MLFHKVDDVKVEIFSTFHVAREVHWWGACWNTTINGASYMIAAIEGEDM
jgi:hypothetical protein